MKTNQTTRTNANTNCEPGALTLTLTINLEIDPSSAPLPAPSADRPFTVRARFVHNAHDYGNGYYAILTLPHLPADDRDRVVDLRYAPTDVFNPCRKGGWLIHWACDYIQARADVWHVKRLSRLTLDPVEP